MLPEPAFVLADCHVGLPWVAWLSLPSDHEPLEGRDQDPLISLSVYAGSDTFAE